MPEPLVWNMSLDGNECLFGWVWSIEGMESSLGIDTLLPSRGMHP